MKPLLAILCLLIFPYISYAENFDDGVNAFEDENYTEAFRIFNALAERGHVDAINNLATLYQTGKGTILNYLFAVEHYRDAATMGHINAAFNLSNLTRLGIGTEKNLGEAYAWAILAARYGASDLIAYRNTLKTYLNEEELINAYRMAKTLLEVLEDQELSSTWMIPSELKNSLPEHIKSSLASRKAQKNRATSQKTASKNGPANKNIEVPEGFTTLSPNLSSKKQNYFDNQSISKTPLSNQNPLPKNIKIPAGFTSLSPQSSSTPKNNQFDNESLQNTPPRTRSTLPNDIKIPAGFTALSPRSSASNNNQFDNQSLQNMPSTAQNRLPDGTDIPSGFSAITPNTKTETNMVDGVTIPEGFTALTPYKNKTGEEIPNIDEKSEPKNDTSMPNTNKQRTFSTSMGRNNQTLYRPQTEGKMRYKNATIIKPRRVIPAKETKIFQNYEIDPALQQMVQSIADSWKVTFKQTFDAILRKNPKAFKKNDAGIIIQINPDHPLIMPSKNDISP